MNCAKVLFLKPPQKTMKRMAKCLTAEAADEARAVKRERQQKQRQQKKRAQEKHWLVMQEGWRIGSRLGDVGNRSNSMGLALH